MKKRIQNNVDFTYKEKTLKHDKDMIEKIKKVMSENIKTIIKYFCEK